MYKDKKAKERIELGDRLTFSLELLSLNQGLIAFADSKANGLVLANSIFILAMAPALEKLHSAPTLVLAAQGGFFCVTILALLASLWVTTSRAASSDEPRPKSIVFFKHIANMARGSTYVDEVRESDGERVLESLLLSNYDLSQIAKAKFSAFKLAESLTLFAAMLWIAAMIVQVVVK